jgi:Holliday junction resolvase-like predicted endonuclease
MAALITSREVEAVVRTALAREGYKASTERGYGETGADIIAKKSDEVFHIEVIAFKSSPPARAKDFYEGFFRAVARLDEGVTECVIALRV